MPANYTIKESITLALIRLMETKPYEKITVADIVRKSGVCRASFYRNYSDKEDILRNYIKYAMKNCPEYYSEQVEQDERKHILGICETMLQHRALFDSLRKNHLLHLLHEQILEMALSYVRRHQLSLDNYQLAAASHAALGLLLEWISGGFRESQEEMAALCIRLLQLPDCPGM